MKALFWALTALPFLSLTADAHDWYVGKRDPVTGGGCCTTSATAKWGDCNELLIEPGVLEPVPEGYRIRLTVEQARRLNPLRNTPVDTIVPEERIQESGDGNWHMCIPRIQLDSMRADFYCFFRPGLM
jgi:hypothetical protein